MLIKVSWEVESTKIYSPSFIHKEKGNHDDNDDVYSSQGNSHPQFSSSFVKHGSTCEIWSCKEKNGHALICKCLWWRNHRILRWQTAWTSWTRMSFRNQKSILTNCEIWTLVSGKDAEEFEKDYSTGCQFWICLHPTLKTQIEKPFTTCSLLPSCGESKGFIMWSFSIRVLWP